MLVYPALEAKRLAMERFIKDAISQSKTYGLNPIHIYVLYELYANDRRHASDLAKSVGQVATSFTPVLDVLERAGHICRQPDPNDRRAVFICLTASGKNLQGAISQLVNKIEKEFNGK